MSTWLSSLFRHIRRRGESGQSVILLAIGFIALLGFVGITTDVSLMFVRYAQLSRAVDSAAIAAANQMRQDRSLATVGLAARQFIEFHGLDPETVWVDTCLTVSLQSPDSPDYKELCTEEQSKLVRVKAYIKQPTVFMRLLGIREFELLASAVSQTAALDVVLIIDVSESMLTETSYEDWAATYEIGIPGSDPVHRNYGVIYRPPTTDTIVRNLLRPQPAYDPNNPSADYLAWLDEYLAISEQLWWNAADAMLKVPQITVNNRLTYGSAADPINGSSTARNPAYLVQYDTNFFANTLKFPPGGRDGTIPPGGYGQATHPREECRVRFYPAAGQTNVAGFKAYYFDDPATTDVIYTQKSLVDVYNEIPGLTPWPNSETNASKDPRYRFDGFVPVYNFFGCCNDPDGDGLFEDLNCQPFKQARDATFQFIERIDFIRGDRAAFVTFDRGAFLINPFGVDTAGNTRGAMLDSYDAAYYTLRNLVGVRAEPNFYQYEVGTNPDALDTRWNGYAAGVDYATGQSIPVDYGSVTYAVNSNEPEAHNYPVYDNCPFRNAALPGNRTLFPNSLTNISLPNSAQQDAVTAGYDQTGRGLAWDSYKSEGNYPLMWDPAQINAAPGNRDSYEITMSYEFWASCRGTNMGAALREGNNALLDPETSRRFGTVWVMVLLSDGAAGGSDPVRRVGRKLNLADPYVEYTPGIFGRAGEYGAFGLCPFGTPDNPGELMLITSDLTRPTSKQQGLFPFCSDESPRTRHTCDFRPLKAIDDPGAIYDADYKPNDPSTHTQANIYDVDLSNCDPLYDVDDYARDWADVVGLQALQKNDDTLLPTIFTIGFGLGFNNVYTDPKNPATALVPNPNLPVNDESNWHMAQTNAAQLCELNIANCLGEQLLRYIADVGDNNRIDDDYWQDWLEERVDDTLSGNPEQQGYLYNGEFGVRGPCQTNEPGDSPPLGYYHLPTSTTPQTQASKNQQWGALGPNRNCGNYYFAPSGSELQFVFDDIASRMFTRLSR